MVKVPGTLRHISQEIRDVFFVRILLEESPCRFLPKPHFLPFLSRKPPWLGSSLGRGSFLPFFLIFWFKGKNLFIKGCPASRGPSRCLHRVCFATCGLPSDKERLYHLIEKQASPVFPSYIGSYFLDFDLDFISFLISLNKLFFFFALNLSS